MSLARDHDHHDGDSRADDDQARRGDGTSDAAKLGDQDMSP